MMKYNKILTLLFFALIFIPFSNVEAVTLKDYENKVKKYENELNAAKKAIKQTEGQIQNTKNEIANAQKEVQKLDEEVNQIEKQINNANQEIIEKGNEIKDFYAYYQMSEGENTYLEYAFGADNVTDFIYRMSIVEQMTDYNNEVIEELQNLIDRNEKRTVEITKLNKQLEEKKKQMQAKMVKLGEQKETLEDGGVDSQKQLKIYQDIVKSYKKLGCKSNDVIGVDCAKTASAGVFRRPTKVGYITSNFGSRWGSFHRGVDITSPNQKKEKIYPIANGTIIAKYTDTYGAKILWIEHYDSVNKKWYSSMYCHLSAYAPNLYVGKTVTSDQYIGYMGNTGYVVPAPSKSCPNCGTHLHLEVTPCRMYKDSKCSTWSKYVSYVKKLANNGYKGPRSVINFPSGSKKWTTR